MRERERERERESERERERERESALAYLKWQNLVNLIRGINNGVHCSY